MQGVRWKRAIFFEAGWFSLGAGDGERATTGSGFFHGLRRSWRRRLQAFSFARVLGGGQDKNSWPRHEGGCLECPRSGGTCPPTRMECRFSAHWAFSSSFHPHSEHPTTLKRRRAGCFAAPSLFCPAPVLGAVPEHEAGNCDRRMAADEGLKVGGEWGVPGGSAAVPGDFKGGGVQGVAG